MVQPKYIRGTPKQSRGNKAERTAKGKVEKKPLAKQGGKLRSVKNQIRAVQRLLHKGGLAPKAVAEQEKRLEQLKDALEDHKKGEIQRKHAVKYHKVRFFERVKIERRIARLEKQPADDSPKAVAERAKQLATLREDLQYVIHFPKEEKYVSLLKQAEEPEAQAQLEAERVRLRAIVRTRVADAAMVAEPDEGRSLAAAATDNQVPDHSESEQDDFFLASDESPVRGIDLPVSRAAPLEDAAMLANSSEEENLAEHGRSGQSAGASGAAQQAKKPAGKQRQLGSSRSSTGPRHQQRSHGKPAHQIPGRAAAESQSRTSDATEPQMQRKPHSLLKPGLKHGSKRGQNGDEKQSNSHPAPGKRHKADVGDRRPAQQQAGGARLPVQRGSDSRSTAVRLPKPAQPLAVRAAAKPEEPLRTRAEGGRRRRKKK